MYDGQSLRSFVIQWRDDQLNLTNIEVDFESTHFAYTHIRLVIADRSMITIINYAKEWCVQLSNNKIQFIVNLFLAQILMIRSG